MLPNDVLNVYIRAYIYIDYMYLNILLLVYKSLSLCLKSRVNIYFLGLSASGNMHTGTLHGNLYALVLVYYDALWVLKPGQRFVQERPQLPFDFLPKVPF